MNTQNINQKDPQTLETAMIEAKEALVTKHLEHNPEPLLRAIERPLTAKIEMKSLARKILLVDAIPNGDVLHIYDSDTDQPTFKISNENDEATCSGMRYPLPRVNAVPFRTNFRVEDYSNFKTKYEKINHLIDLLAKEIISREDKALLRVMNLAITQGKVNKVKHGIISDKASSRLAIVEATTEIERWDLLCSNILLNDVYFDKFVETCFDRNDFDKQTHEVVRKGCGFVGTIFGKQIVVSPNVPEGIIYFATEPEFLGVFCTHSGVIMDRISLDGASCHTFTNMVVLNPKGLSCWKDERYV